MSERVSTPISTPISTGPTLWDRTVTLSSGRSVRIERIVTDCRRGPWQRFDWISGERVAAY